MKYVSWYVVRVLALSNICFCFYLTYKVDQDTPRLLALRQNK